MANQLQLQRQIQQEMDREAKIDKLIEKEMKKFLKVNKQYYIVNKVEKCDSILYFDRRTFPLIIKFNPNNSLTIKEINDNNYTKIFLENKNPHDAKRLNVTFRCLIPK